MQNLTGLRKHGLYWDFVDHSFKFIILQALILGINERDIIQRRKVQDFIM